MATPRLTHRAPTACSACYGQYADRLHVDFRAALEGAAINDSPRAPRVDWVVLCENCIRNANELLPEHSGYRVQLENRIDQLQRRADEAENYAASLEDTLARRPGRAEPTPPVSPRRKSRYTKVAA